MQQAVAVMPLGKIKNRSRRCAANWQRDSKRNHFSVRLFLGVITLLEQINQW